MEEKYVTITVYLSDKYTEGEAKKKISAALMQLDAVEDYEYEE